MIGFRPFRNTDPPALAAIWSQQPRQRGLAQPITPIQLEYALLAKHYFDRQGLIVATDDGLPVGFVHAGFGADETGTQLSTEMGVICITMVGAAWRETSLGSQLVAQGEAYLRSRGARVLYAGGIKPLDPFYLGLYGGSELPGILESDTWQQMLYRGCGYEPIDQVVVLHRDLGTFRPSIDRRQMQHRRGLMIQTIQEPHCGNWWEATAHGFCDRVRFEAHGKCGPSELAGATFWNMEPLASSWGLRVAGLLEVQVEPSQRRQGIATHLLGEAFRQLHLQGAALVEVQTMIHNTAAQSLYQKLGFSPIDKGTVLRKKEGCVPADAAL